MFHDFTVEELREASKLIEVYNLLFLSFQKYDAAIGTSELLSPDMSDLFYDKFEDLIDVFEELFVAMGIPHVVKDRTPKEPF